MMAITTSSISPPNLVNISRPKHISTCYQIIPTKTIHSPHISPLTLSKQNIHGKPRKLSFTTAAVTQDAAVSNVIASETSQEIVSATSSGGDGVSTIISVLLFIAFLSLSILTIGVVYIAVTDFLTKREKEKFEKEEEAKMKKGGKKKIATRARDGPRGFGQKIDDFDD